MPFQIIGEEDMVLMGKYKYNHAPLLDAIAKLKPHKLGQNLALRGALKIEFDNVAEANAFRQYVSNIDTSHSKWKYRALVRKGADGKTCTVFVGKIMDY